MDVLGPPAAERATCRDPTRPKGEGDRGSNRIEVPGFEPNAAVRQKAREKVHPPLFGDPSPDHQKWPRAQIIFKMTNDAYWAGAGAVPGSREQGKPEGGLGASAH